MSENTYKKRKQQLLDFFREYNRLPSYSEMLQLFSLKSKNTIAYLVNKFIGDGLVAKDNGGHLTPLKLATRTRLLGSVEAGFPSPAEEELGDSITLDDYLIGHKEATFLLRISGDSMQGAGIQEGDLVLVERGKEAKLGDIVIAEVDGAWTIKRLIQKNGKSVLKPENPKYPDIYPQFSLKIAGVVTSVIRKYY